MDKIPHKNIFLYLSDRLLWRKVLLTSVGIILMGIGVSASVYSGLGTDPCTCINLGISHKIGMEFWKWQCIANAIIFIIPLIFSRKMIGYGTVVNMFFVGIIADTVRGTVYHAFLPAQPANLWVRVGFMLFGVLILGLGAAFYMIPSLGVAPYDSIPLILAEHLPIQFRWIRVAFDVTNLVIGWLLGSTIGVGTVLVAFCLGPMIHFFGEKIRKKFLPMSQDVL
ncbi:MAG TPA: DUF6198 family protein [Caproicibacter sp.]|nr:DUF6198 family protein [Caproicibacter sp.]